MGAENPVQGGPSNPKHQKIDSHEKVGHSEVEDQEMVGSSGSSKFLLSCVVKEFDFMNYYSLIKKMIPSLIKEFESHFSFYIFRSFKATNC